MLDLLMQQMKHNNKCILYDDIFPLRGVVAEAALSQCDMAEELSRQLEDILSTYCWESISNDASALPNGQSHSPELNGLTKEKPEGGGVNGGDNAVEKEKKKTQDKKKVKGLGKCTSLGIHQQICFTLCLCVVEHLNNSDTSVFLAYAGKEITLLMQTLNTLSTPEEKLGGLCKKYADLVSGFLLFQSQHFS